MGPSEIDLFGFTKEASGIPEDLHWVAKRTLMKPPTKRIPEVLNYIEMVVDKTEQKYPPSLWENCTVLITPTWATALSWEKLTTMRIAWLDLGRNPDPSLVAWEKRNSHAPSWTASLCNIKTPSGRLILSGST